MNKAFTTIHRHPSTSYLFLGECSARTKQIHEARGDATIDIEDKRFPLLGSYLIKLYRCLKSPSTQRKDRFYIINPRLAVFFGSTYETQAQPDLLPVVLLI